MTGGDGEGARADGAAAGDVVGRVPDDPGPLGCEDHAVVLARAVQGERPELVAQLVIIGEGPEGERFPEAMMRELDLGATPPTLVAQSQDGGCKWNAVKA